MTLSPQQTNHILQAKLFRIDVYSSLSSYEASSEGYDSAIELATHLPDTSFLVNIHVNVTAQLPRLEMSPFAIVGEEDQPVRLLDVSNDINVVLLDSGTQSTQSQCTISIFSANGRFHIIPITKPTLDMDNIVKWESHVSHGEHVFNLTGALRDMQRHLDQLIFTPSDHWVKENSARFQLIFMDVAQEPVELRMFFMPVNDAPRIVSLSYEDIGPAGVVEQNAITSLNPFQLYVLDVDVSDGHGYDNGCVFVTLTSLCGGILVNDIAPSDSFSIAALQLSVHLSYPGKNGTASCFANRLVLEGEINAADAVPWNVEQGTPVDSRTYEHIAYHRLTIHGPLNVVNQFLMGSLSFKAPMKLPRTESALASIEIEASDLGNHGSGGTKSTSSTLSLQVSPIKQSLDIQLKRRSVDLLEDSTLEADAFLENIVDVTDLEQDQRLFIFEVKANVVGHESMREKFPVNIHIPKFKKSNFAQNAFVDVDVGLHRGHANFSSQMQAMGPLARTITFSFPRHFHGVVEIILSVHFAETFGTSEIGELVASTILVHLHPVNDIPSIDVAAKYMQEDAPIKLPISVHDPDIAFLIESGSALIEAAAEYTTWMEVKFICTHCFFFGAAGNKKAADNEFSFRGTMMDINSALDSIFIQGESDFSGLAFILVWVNDLGNYGDNSEASVLHSNVTITVQPVNDPPRLSINEKVIYASEFISEAVVNITTRDSHGQLEVLHDVDGNPDDLLYFEITCSHGEFIYSSDTIVPSLDLFELANATSNKLTGKSNAADLNTFLLDLQFVAGSHTEGRDFINITVVDVKDAFATTILPVMVEGIGMAPSAEIALNISDSVLHVAEDGIFDFPSINISNPNALDLHRYLSTRHLEVSVSAAHGGAVGIQEVTTTAPHINDIQEIEIFPLSENDNITGGGWFKLKLEVASNAHCGAPLPELGSGFPGGQRADMISLVTMPIWSDAVAMRLYERTGFSFGGNSNESMQSKLEDMLKTCNDADREKESVRVEVTREGSSTGGYLWRVTFIGVSFDFGTLEVESVNINTTATEITTGGGVAVAARKTRAGNRVGGKFTLGFGMDVTPPLPHNISAEAMTSALMSLDSIDAVSVTRSLVSPEGGYTWSVTFFGVTLPAYDSGGGIPLLMTNGTQLTGDWQHVDYGTGVNLAISNAKVTSAHRQLAVGSPRVISVSTYANHVDEVVEITRILPDAPSVESVESISGAASSQYEEFFLRVYHPVQTHLYEVIGPIHVATVAMKTAEVGGVGYDRADKDAHSTPHHIPSHSQPAGTRKGESLESLLTGVSFFHEFVESVTITKTSIRVGNESTLNLETHTIWRVVFHGASFQNLVIEYDNVNPIVVDIDAVTEEIVEITRKLPQAPSQNQVRHDTFHAFYLRIHHPEVPSIFETVGPIHVATVPMIQDESGTKDSDNDPGTRAGESIEALLTSVSFFDEFFSSVIVSRNITGSEDVVFTTWRARFTKIPRIEFNLIHSQAVYERLTMSLVPEITVVQVTPPNAVSGNFRLSYGGYLTQPLHYNASCDEMKEALLMIPTLHNEVLGLGTVMVGRSGPTIDREYTWYVVFQMDSEVRYELSSATMADGGSHLLGDGASVTVRHVRHGVHSYGFRLPKPVAGLFNAGGGDLFEFREVCILAGTDQVLAAALSNLQYMAMQDWNGLVTVTMRVSDHEDTDGSSSLLRESVTSFSVEVEPVNDPPVLFWRNEILDREALLVVYEDSDARLGGEYVLFESNTEGGFGERDVNGNAVLGTMDGDEPRRDTSSRQQRGLFIVDRDSNEGIMNVELSCTRGRLSVRRESPSVGIPATVIRTANLFDAHARISNYSAPIPSLQDDGVMALPSERLVLTGDVYEINDLLSGLRYAPELNVYGYDYINITVWDNGHQGKVFSNLSNAFDNQLLTVRILPVNDKPVISFISAKVGTLYDDETSWEVGVLQLEEDTLYLLGNEFNISDVDMDMDNVEWGATGDWRKYGTWTNEAYLERNSLRNDSFAVNLSVQFGVLKLPFEGAVHVSYSDPSFYEDLVTGYRNIYLFGSFHEVTDILKSLSYVGDTNWYGVDDFTISVDDKGNFGKGGAQSLTRHLILEVAPIADGPVLIVPSSSPLLTMEDMTGIIGVDDSGDFTTLSTDIAKASGIRTQELVEMSTLGFIVYDQDVIVARNEVRFIIRKTDNIGNIYNIIQGHHYHPHTNDPVYNKTYAHSDSVDFKEFDTTAVPFNTPVIVNSTMTISLNTSHGVLSLHRIPDSITFIHGSGLHDDYMVFAGPVKDVNRALQSLQYVPDLNWNSGQGGRDAAARGISVLERIYIHVKDANLLCDENYLDVIVEAANDPPVLAMGSLTIHDAIPAGRAEIDQVSRRRIRINPLLCNEDSLCPLEGLRVRDIDANEDVSAGMRLSLIASNGSFSIDHTLSPVAYQVLEVSQTTLYSKLEFSFPASQISTALEGISYLPRRDYFGSDEIVITVNDMGNTGQGLLCEEGGIALGTIRPELCKLTDTMILPVLIIGQPDVPTVIVPGQVFEVQEDAAVVITGVSLIDTDDPLGSNGWHLPDWDEMGDHDDKTIEITLSSSDGLLYMKSLSTNLKFLIGDGFSGKSYLQLLGSLSDINEALRVLSFKPRKDFNSRDEGKLAVINIVAVDVLHRHDFGNVASTKRDIFVRVVPANDYPTVHLPGMTLLNPDLVKPSSRSWNMTKVPTVFIDEDTVYCMKEVSVSDPDERRTRFEDNVVSSNNLMSTERRFSWTIVMKCFHGQFSSTNYTVRRLLNVVESERSGSFMGYTTDAIHSILQHVNYVPDPNFNGPDLIDVEVCDDGIPPLCDTKTLPISIRPINDAPRWTSEQLPLVTGEDESLGIGDFISLNDIDSYENHIFVTISVQHGLLTCPTVPASVSFLLGTGESDTEIHLTGPVIFLNELISQLIYKPPPHWNTKKLSLVDSVSFFVDDWGYSDFLNANRTAAETGEQSSSAYNDVSLPSLTDTTTLFVLVQEGVNNKPYVNVPGAEYKLLPCESGIGRVSVTRISQLPPKENTCEVIESIARIDILEDTVHKIVGISVHDVDIASNNQDGIFFLVLTVVHGRLSLPTAAVNGVFVEENVSVFGNISARGTLSQLNNCLNSLTYQALPEYYGPDFLSIYINDMGNSGGGGPQWSNETIPLRILPLDDDPVLHAPSQILHVVEDNRLVIDDVFITDNDYQESVAGPATYNRDEIFEPTVSWNETVFRTQSSGIHRLTIESPHGAVMLASTLGLSISNTPNTTEEHQRLSKLPVFGSSLDRKSYVGVESHNKAQMDDDALPAKVSSMDSYIWWKRITVEGRLDNINRAISQITYQPDINWNSQLTDDLDILNITVEDIGNATNIVTVRKIVRINVISVLDLPVLFVPGEVYHSSRMSSDLLSSLVVDTNVIYIDEDSGMLLIEGSSVRSIDTVNEDDFLSLTITATFGTIQMVGLIEYSMTQGSGQLDGIEGLILDVNENSVISLRAPHSIVNRALRKIGFTPESNYNGPSAGIFITVAHSSGSAHVTASSQEASLSSHQSDSRYIRIDVAQKNDAPVVSVGDDPDVVSIFTVSEGDVIRVDGVKNLNLNDNLIGSGFDSRASSGYELWKFDEDLGSIKKASEPSSKILGSLEWSSGQVSDINPGDLSSNPRYAITFTYLVLVLRKSCLNSCYLLFQVFDKLQRFCVFPSRRRLARRRIVEARR